MHFTSRYLCRALAVSIMLSWACRDDAKDTEIHSALDNCQCTVEFREQGTFMAFLRYQDSFVPVLAKDIDGEAIFEGDIVLGAVWKVRAQMKLIERLGGFDRLNEIFRRYKMRGAAVSPHQLDALSPQLEEILGHIDAAQAWPNETVYYSFSVRDTKLEEIVGAAIREWENGTGLSFVKADRMPKEVRQIRFKAARGMCSWDPQTQVARVAADCVRHEIGHALGLLHEHTRSDRDQFIEVVPTNIETSRCSLFKPNDIESARCGSYDLESIMHYGALDFSCNESPTLVAIRGTIRPPDGPISAGDIDTVKFVQGLGPCSN
jgi:Astacin (Peptidase family M12A)